MKSGSLGVKPLSDQHPLPYPPGMVACVMILQLVMRTGRDGICGGRLRHAAQVLPPEGLGPFAITGDRLVSATSARVVTPKANIFMSEPQSI
jgi:hypothetical protein